MNQLLEIEPHEIEEAILDWVEKNHADRFTEETIQIVVTVVARNSAPTADTVELTVPRALVPPGEPVPNYRVKVTAVQKSHL